MSTPTSPLSESDLDFGPTLRGLRAGLKVFGQRYELIRQLGRGGMGVVWLARDGKLHLDVALKLLPETLRGDKVAVDELRSETRRCLQLTHDLIVRTYDLAEDEDMVAIVMEYVDGSTLAELRLGRPSRCFDVAEIEPWLQQICAALAYAHEGVRMVHRDLKPSNIMLNAATGRLKLADFGIASSLSDTISRMTRAGASPASGTLVYMSPQQLMGFPPAVTDDVYSLGATLYELFTGKPPFFRGSIERQIESVSPPSMTQRRAELNVEGMAPIPANWEALVAAWLDKDSARRQQSVAALWQILSGSPAAASAPPPRPAPGTQAQRPPGSFTKPPSRPTTKLARPSPKKSPEPVATPQKAPPGRKALIATVLLLLPLGSAAGWWFGLEAPRRAVAAHAERQRQETEAAQKASEIAEATRLAKEQADAEARRLAKEKANAEEKARQMAARVESDRIAREKADAERHKLRSLIAEGTALESRVRDLQQKLGQSPGASKDWEAMDFSSARSMKAFFESLEQKLKDEIENKPSIRLLAPRSFTVPQHTEITVLKNDESGLPWSDYTSDIGPTHVEIDSDKLSLRFTARTTQSARPGEKLNTGKLRASGTATYEYGTFAGFVDHFANDKSSLNLGSKYASHMGLDKNVRSTGWCAIPFGICKVIQKPVGDTILPKDGFESNDPIIISASQTMHGCLLVNIEDSRVYAFCGSLIGYMGHIVPINDPGP